MLRSTIMVAVTLAIGCGETGAPATLGVVAMSGAPTGNIVLVNVATGEERVLDDQGGPYGTVSISPDGVHVAYSYDHRPTLDRSVNAVDTQSGVVRRISPSTGQWYPNFRWGRGGAFWYVAGIPGEGRRTVIVSPGETTGRLIGSPREYTPIVEAPTGDRIAYIDGSEIVVELWDGSDRRVVAISVGAQIVGFLPDGAALVTRESASEADDVRLTFRSTDGTVVRDLAPAGLGFGAIPGGSLLSPSGDEVLAPRASGLVAVSVLDGSERTISEGPVVRAGFTATGIVVYMVSRNTEDPPDDTPEEVYSFWAVDAQGMRWLLRDEDPYCYAARLSPTGTLVALDCPGTPVHRVATGEEISTTDGSRVLGFDANETGLVVTDFSSASITYTSFSGGSHLVAQEYNENDVMWPRSSYAPYP